jgi:hypothetical protein
MPATKTVVEIIESMKSRIREQSTDLIIEALMLMPGESTGMPAEALAARACLLDIYEEREGEDAVDAMMELLGM